MKYLFLILALGFIMNYHLSTVNHTCIESERVGRGVIKKCSQLEARNSFHNQQTVFGRAIVK